MNQTILQIKYQTIWDSYKETELNMETASHPTKLLDREFVFQYDDDETDCDLLFIGINPSYKGHDQDENRFYNREQALQHNYFEPFQTISDKLKSTYFLDLKWTHLDCLVFRETNQKFIKKFLFKKDLKFITDQLTVARERIEHIKPKVIVVSNTMARKLMGNDRFTHNDEIHNIWMGLEFEFCPILGTHKIINHSTLSGTPVFFTSMLSGQRALDNGSKERLIWHVAKVLNA